MIIPTVLGIQENCTPNALDYVFYAAGMVLIGRWLWWIIKYLAYLFWWPSYDTYRVIKMHLATVRKIQYHTLILPSIKFWGMKFKSNFLDHLKGHRRTG